MAYSAEVMAAVRGAFVYEQLTMEAAAAKHGVPVVTARRWKVAAGVRGDDWETLRAAYVMTEGGLEETSRHVLMSFMVQHRAVMDELTECADVSPLNRANALVGLADAFNKMVASSRRVLPEVSRLAVALGVIQDLAEYVQKVKPEALPVFVELLDGFGAVVEVKYGK